MAKDGRLVIDDLTGGINGYDPPWALAANQVVDAVNVDWFRSRFAHKRLGWLNIATTFSAGGPFDTEIYTLIRHVPGADDTAAELWAVASISSNGSFGRMAGAATFTQPTMKDATTGTAYQVTGVSINTHLALAYQTAVARMHKWDKSTVRRSGLAATAAPTAANGGGAGVATLRYYRERSTRQSGGVTIGRSEPSASVSFTPGANGVTVTQAAVINEGETHWEIEGSVDGITFYRIGTVVIATTTYLDNADPTTYNTNPLSATTGTYTLQKPYKYIAADQNRVLGLASYTSTDKQSRVEISAVIGSLDVGDDERVDTTTNYFLDFDEADSGAGTGIAGPVLGSFFVFKLKQIWRLSATGNVSQPFRADAISKAIGAVTHRSIVVGEDAHGNPCLYWMSHRGPYRWGTNGLEYIGRGIENFVSGPTAFIYLAAQDDRSAFSVYFQDVRQVWFFAACSAGGGTIGAAAMALFKYDVEKDAWSRDTVIPQNALCAVMFSNTLGAAMSLDLKPYIGYDSGSHQPVIFKGNTGNNDSGVGYQAYITTRAYEPGGPGFNGQLSDALLTAAAASGVTITATVTPDFNAATAKTATALLTAAGSETRVTKRLEDSTLSGAEFYQYTIGDAAATTAAWTLDRLVVQATQKESLI